MSSPFAAPAPPGDGITWAELNGSLLLIEPHAYETGIKTTFGEADAVRAAVHVLDGTNAGTTYGDTLVFPKLLSGQLKAQIGQKVLGRLGQGTAKPGQSPPWLLHPATDADQQTGLAWLNQQPSPIAQPAPAAQGAPQQWQGQQQQGQTVPF